MTVWFIIAIRNKNSIKIRTISLFLKFKNIFKAINISMNLTILSIKFIIFFTLRHPKSMLHKLRKKIMISLFFLFFSFTFIYTCSTPFILILIMFISLIIFNTLWSFSGYTWFPLILALLFVGGILVIFMVISSLFPNSKNFLQQLGRFKIFSFISLSIFFLFYFPFTIFSFECFSIKTIILRGGNFLSLGFIILCYFFCFLYFISKDKVSLRRFF